MDDQGSAGGSAEAEARRLEDRARQLEEQAARARARGRNFQSGAAGEQLTEAVLAGHADLESLHDLRMPRSVANIDHVVVAPSGVFVIDSKNYKGRVSYSKDTLWHDRYPLTQKVAQLLRARRAVVDVIGPLSEPLVHGVMCIHGAEVADGIPAVGGVTVLPGDRLVEFLRTGPERLSPARRSGIATALRRELGRERADSADVILAAEEVVRSTRLPPPTVPAPRAPRKKVPQSPRRQAPPSRQRDRRSWSGELVRALVVIAVALTLLAVVPKVIQGAVGAGVRPGAMTTTSSVATRPLSAGGQAPNGEFACGMDGAWRFTYEWPGTPNGFKEHLFEWREQASSSWSVAASWSDPAVRMGIDRVPPGAAFVVRLRTIVGDQTGPAGERAFSAPASGC